MKIGDKVYCIKDAQTYNNELLNKKGKTYEIKDIKNDYYLISCEDRKYKYQQVLNVIMYNKSENNTLQMKYFNEHFMSEKELRKNKIQKLNEQILVST